MSSSPETPSSANRRARRPTVAEESFLGRLAGWCHDHRRRVLGLWILGIIALTAISQVVGTRYQDNFSSGNSESQRVENILAARFPRTAGTTADVVVHTTADVATPVVVARTNQMVERLETLPDVSGVTSPFAPGAVHQISSDRHIAFAVVQFDKDQATIANSSVTKLVDVAQSFARPGYDVELGGQVIGKVIAPKPGPSEGIGITAAMIIMLIAFGSVVAMGLPIMAALFGIAIGFALQDLLSHVLNVPIFAPEMLAMIGLGVGIDYALFIVTRFRQGLGEGRDPRAAVAAALATSGRAVLFAGCTVIISLLGLFIVNLPFMQGLAVGAIAAVLLVMAAALTLLPAMLGFAGPAIDRLRLPGRRRSAVPSEGRGFWYRWSRTIQRHPVTAGLSAVIVLGLLAIPLFSMRLAFTDAGNDPAGLTTRQAYDLLAEGFGPGFNGPLVLAAVLPPGASESTLTTVDDALRSTPGVAFATPPVLNADHSTAVIIAYPTTAPQAATTAELVTTLRHRVIPTATAGTGVKVLVGGETAGGVDAAGYLSSRLFWVIGGVIVLAFLLLMAVFRSVVIPVKAAVMNLLSVGAAYGVIVAVFQWGWGGSVIGIGRTGPIDPWIPLMMFTILFGLSMDYEVFLLSRMREEWLRTRVNTTAVADGLAKTARVITAAAAIMICVFGSFVIGDPLRVLKVFGLGLAASIVIDASLVRMVLVPSVMELLGRSNWYMPRWLDRVVPTLGVEVDVEEGAVREGPPDERPADASLMPVT
ncbi:MAG TPA: MMPL family transporter [Acidimicrobiales bacterium]|nr:MMPL family transporter [Acidimicrobiales bacterium]